MRGPQSYLVSFFPCILTHEFFRDVRDQMSRVPFTVLREFPGPEAELPMAEEILRSERIYYEEEAIV